MASSWIIARPTKDGGRRYRVLYRLGGRESKANYGGSFPTKAEAVARRKWIDGELAALRVPDLHMLEQKPARQPTLADEARRWQESRVDVTENTRLQHRSAIRAAVPELCARTVDSISPADVASLVAALAAKRPQAETIRKTLNAFATFWSAHPRVCAVVSLLSGSE